jgi:TatD DNase family protein
MGTLFDTHAHLNDPRFDEDRADVLERMKQNEVLFCVVVGSDIETSQSARDYVQDKAGLYFAAGVHPHEAKDWREGDDARLSAMLADEKAVALGEIGLDYHYDNSPRTDQRRVFEEQLDCASALNKPVILHVREAHADTLAILHARKNRLPSAVVHCFSGSWETAKQYLDLGLMISLAGPVTFKNANKLIDVARYVPEDRLMIETDSPYLAPEPRRGRRNEPTYVGFIAKRVAEIRGIEETVVRRFTLANGLRFFGIDERMC